MPMSQYVGAWLSCTQYMQLQTFMEIYERRSLDALITVITSDLELSFQASHIRAR